MLEKTTTMLRESLEQKNFSSLFAEESEMKDYKAIFNILRDDWNIKKKINQKQAREIDQYLKKEFEITAREHTLKKVKFGIGDVSVQSKYLEQVA